MGCSSDYTPHSDLTVFILKQDPNIFFFPIQLQTLPTLQQEVMEWEQKFKSLQSLDSLRTKVDQLKNEMAWALVHEREKVSHLYMILRVIYGVSVVVVDWWWWWWVPCGYSAFQHQDTQKGSLLRWVPNRNGIQNSTIGSWLPKGVKEIMDPRHQWNIKSTTVHVIIIRLGHETMVCAVCLSMFLWIQ